jgi:hypothetical protein
VSKWALWAAHRYVRAGAAVPRQVGVDGRTLYRPWRQVSEHTRATVSVLRAQRVQPLWPRSVGWACLGMAVLFALQQPGAPVPPHVAGSASARPGPRLASPSALSPAGPSGLTAASRFTWRAAGAEPPFALLVFDAKLDPVLRRDGIDGTAWTPDADALALLQRTGTFHWQVLGDGCGRPLASALQTVLPATAPTTGVIVR